MLSSSHPPPRLCSQTLVASSMITLPVLVRDPVLAAHANLLWTTNQLGLVCKPWTGLANWTGLIGLT